MAERLSRQSVSGKPPRSAESCRTKIKSLTQLYKKCRDNNRFVPLFNIKICAKRLRKHAENTPRKCADKKIIR